MINSIKQKNISLEDLSKTMYACLPATVARNYNLETAEDRDLKRAEIVKANLN